MSDIVVGPDRRARCAWPTGDELYLRYHDEEWGRAVADDRRLYEKLVLEGFQAGLAWITVLRKRDRFREVFEDFEPARVATFGEPDMARLLGDPGIIRHRGKIEAAINNASRALELIDEFGSLAPYAWSWAPQQPAPRALSDVPPLTPESIALSKDLKRRGWKFVGPTTVYAFMQAMGMVNDHLAGCWVRAECDATREEVLSRFG